MAKLLAVVGGLLADSYPVLVACSMVCSYLLLGMYVLSHACTPSFAYYRARRYVATTLPFFNRYMNQFRVSASFLVAFLSCGSVILSTAKPSSPGTFSAIWIGLSLFVIAAASLLPRLRMKMLRDKLMAMRPRMLEELDEKHKCVRTTDMNPLCGLIGVVVCHDPAMFPPAGKPTVAPNATSRKAPCHTDAGRCACPSRKWRAVCGTPTSGRRDCRSE